MSERELESLLAKYDSERYYTLTIKPTAKWARGDRIELFMALNLIENILDAFTIFSECEKEGTPALHLHALIRCPYIKDKTIIRQNLYGYHTHLDIVRKGKDIEDIWKLYINKEVSDSERYHKVYGNMFI